jgi:TolB protein
MCSESRRPIGDVLIAVVAVVVLAALATACSDQSKLPTSPAARTPSLGKGFTPNGPGALPQRGRIAFSSTVTGDEELYTMNEDGTGLLRLTYHAGPDQTPVWSPDGKKISFIRPGTAATEVFVMNADGSGIKQLTYLGKPHVGAMSWSPDSKRIVFMVGSSPNFDDYDLYVINSGGGAAARLTTDPASEAYPTWSPDGAKIAFASNRTGPYQIFIMNADGTSPVQFTQCISAGCLFPAWSPDGSRIAYNSLTSNNIYTSPVTNGGQMDLLVANAYFPEWAPDGVKLVFLNYGTNELDTINADGSGQTQITFMSSTEAYPTWGRKP